MQRNKLVALIVSIIILISFVVGISYAYLRKTPVQTNENVISTLSCLEVTLTSETAGINLEKAIPISDADGLKTPGYTFKIKNNCDTKALAEINLESLKMEEPNEAIAVNYIKYSINGSTPVLVSSREAKDATITDANSRNLLMVMLNKQEEKEYNLKLWLNESTTPAQALGKVYEGKVVIVANATNLKCANKPSEFTNAEDGTILAALNSDDYCFLDNPMTTPGKQISVEYENIIASDQDDYGTSYYFRGAVENNYVVFANMCWRIVRIDGAGNTKLTLYNYNPTGAPNPCADSLDGNTMAFARVNNSYKSKFNTDYNHNTFIGYMYGDVNGSTYEEVHANTNKSAILTFLMTWYDEKLRSYNDLLADTIWCNDKSIVTETTYDPRSIGNILGTGINKDKTYYGATKRLLPAASAFPSLKCGETTEDNKISKFTASDKTNGNGALTFEGKEYKIGLLTADEIAFAGATAGAGNSSYYLYKNANYGPTGTNWYWSLSPRDFGGIYANVWIIKERGHLDGVGVNDSYGVRPAVSLKSTASITSGGNGTQSNPFVVAG